jgi:hypothetical protein
MERADKWDLEPQRFGPNLPSRMPPPLHMDRHFSRAARRRRARDRGRCATQRRLIPPPIPQRRLIISCRFPPSVRPRAAVLLSTPSRIGGFGSRASVLGPFHGEQVALRRSNHGWWSSVLARGSERARGRAGEIATVLVVHS